MRIALKRLFFGDFLLARQKKVTPPPGGTPGMGLAIKPRQQEAATRHAELTP
jgi:hypothetical protein